MAESQEPTQLNLADLLELIRDEAWGAYHGKTETDETWDAYRGKTDDSLLAIMCWADDALERVRDRHD